MSGTVLIGEHLEKATAALWHGNGAKFMNVALTSYMNLSQIKKSGRSYKEAIPFYVPGGRLWAGLTLVISVILTIVTFLSTSDVVIGGLIAVTFFVVMWLYYIWWKNYNRKKGIDIVAEAEKYESIPSDWE